LRLAGCRWITRSACQKRPSRENRPRRRFHLPGFDRRNRGRRPAVAAQFRFDQLRMAILGIVPLILFYLLLD
jgi:hypothetical protein